MATGMPDVSEYLRRPYARIVTPETDGTFRGEILEFPGCIATGDTPAEALSTLESAATNWLNAALERNQDIPRPLENSEYSGRLVVRMPKSLHKKAARVAELERVSLNQFILTSIAEHVGERSSKSDTNIQFHLENQVRMIIDNWLVAVTNNWSGAAIVGDRTAFVPRATVDATGQINTASFHGLFQKVPSITIPTVTS